MKFITLKPVVLVLIVSVTLTSMMQSRAEAMLIPAHLAQAAQEVNPTADLQTIRQTLESKVLRARLHALGLSDAEMESRLSRLSDAQKHQLASQIRAVHPAGDGGGFVIGVLIIVLLVLLIIYLVKRV